MDEICLTHNAYKEQDCHWFYPEDDVTEIVRKAMRPVTISHCPKCLDRTKLLAAFLNMEIREGTNVIQTKKETAEAKQIRGALSEPT